MTQKILFSVHELQAAATDEDWLVVDCRFVLDKPDAGYQAYLDAHIPGAVYAHLDDELASPVTRASGRHPLPDAAEFSEFLSRLGWLPGRTLLAYDDLGGAIAARLWWLMKYFGHDSAAMLDGGITAWTKAGYELESGPVQIAPAPLVSFDERSELVLSTPKIMEAMTTGAILLVDARAPERFDGEVEPIDRVAGHIPGSFNYPFNLNLNSSGLFKSAREIRKGFSKLIENQTSKELVHMCGSGVTACHNIFAAELAGIMHCKLYVGSWSEWIQDPSRPVTP